MTPRLRLNPKLAAAFCHRLAALACGEGGAVARVAAALAAVAPALAPAPGASRRRTRTASSAARGPRLRASRRRFLGAAPVARVRPPPPPPPRAPRAPPAARRPRGRRRRRRRRRAPPPRRARGRGPPPRGRLRYLRSAGVVEAGSARWAAAAAFRLCATAPAASSAPSRRGAPPSSCSAACSPARPSGGAGRLSRYAPTCVSRAARAVAGAYLDLAAAFATTTTAPRSAALAGRTRTRWRAAAIPTSRAPRRARRRRAASSVEISGEFGCLLPRPPRPPHRRQTPWRERRRVDRRPPCR